MNTKATLTYALMALCLGAGLILVKINLDHASANVLNWGVVALIFYGAWSCWKKAEKLSG